MKEELFKRIDILAAKLQTTAGHLWGVLVAQARVEAIESIVYLVFWMAVAAVCSLGIWRITISKTDEDQSGLFMLCLCVLVIALGGAFVECGHIATGFLNPEYWALMKLKELL